MKKFLLVLASLSLFSACGAQRTTLAQLKDDDTSGRSGKIVLIAGDASSFIDALMNSGVEGNNQGGDRRVYQASSIDCSVPVVPEPRATCTLRLVDGRVTNPSGSAAAELLDILMRRGGRLDSGTLGTRAAAADNITCIRLLNQTTQTNCTMYVNVRNF